MTTGPRGVLLGCRISGVGKGLWTFLTRRNLGDGDDNMWMKQQPNSLPRRANQDVAMTTSNDYLPSIVGIVRANGRWRMQKNAK